MLPAEIDAGWLVGLGGFLTALVTAYLTLRERAAKTRKDTLTEWQEFAAKQEARCVKLEEQIERYDKTVSQFQQVVAECCQENATLRSAIYFLNEERKHFHAMLVGAGIDPGPLPELPPLPSGDFLRRQAEQAATMLRAADAAIRPPAEGKP